MGSRLVTITTRADDYWREVSTFSVTVKNSLCASGNGETTTTTDTLVRCGKRNACTNHGYMVVLPHGSLNVKWKYMDIQSTFTKMKVKAEFLS